MEEDEEVMSNKMRKSAAESPQLDGNVLEKVREEEMRQQKEKRGRESSV